jgi:hypothetical protein
MTLGPVRFPLGRVVATPNAIASCGGDPSAFTPILDRHSSGDWGDVDDADKKSNDRALIDGTRILSAYTVNGVKVWIITEADRSVTTVLLPEDY